MSIRPGKINRTGVDTWKVWNIIRGSTVKHYRPFGLVKTKFSVKKNTPDWYKSVRTEGFFSASASKTTADGEKVCEAQKITDSHHRWDARNVICVNFKSTTKRLCTQEISKKLFKHFMQSVKAFSRWSKIVLNTIWSTSRAPTCPNIVSKFSVVTRFATLIHLRCRKERTDKINLRFVSACHTAI